jgi:hypothetical protein
VNDEVEKTEKVTTKSDWVTKRSSCSLPKIFKDLRVQVEEDVKTRNALRPENSPYEFSMVEKGNDFTVLLEAKDAHRSVLFTLAADAILVRDDKGNQMFDVTLAFSDDGECRLYVDKKECDVWQVRRLALEELFFLGD